MRLKALECVAAVLEAALQAGSEVRSELQSETTAPLVGHLSSLFLQASLLSDLFALDGMHRCCHAPVASL